MRFANVYNFIQRLVEHVYLRPKPEDPRCVNILHVGMTLIRSGGCLKTFCLQLELHLAFLEVLFPLELGVFICFDIQKVELLLQPFFVEVRIENIQMQRNCLLIVANFLVK